MEDPTKNGLRCGKWGVRSTKFRRSRGQQSSLKITPATPISKRKRDAPSPTSSANSVTGENSVLVVRRGDSSNGLRGLRSLQRGVSKEVAYSEEIASSSLLVKGGEIAHPQETYSVLPVIVNADSRDMSLVVSRVGPSVFGVSSTLGVAGGVTQGANSLVNNVAPSIVGVTTTFGATGEIMASTDDVVEERDGEFVVIRRDDGSVVLKKGDRAVAVSLEYFDGVEDRYKPRMLYILQIHPSTFIGLGDMSLFVRECVLNDFGKYLEFFDRVKLSTDGVDDMHFLHRKLVELKSDGLEVKWLLDRHERMAAQMEMARFSVEIERLNVALRTAEATVAHGEEKLRKARALVNRLEGEKAIFVGKLNASAEVATSEFDLDGNWGQGLSG